MSMIVVQYQMLYIDYGTLFPRDSLNKINLLEFLAFERAFLYKF